MSFSEFQDLALYHPQAGFYANAGGAGRTGDFITSPEVGPLFGHVLANAIDKWWRQLGRPDPFFVFEAGAATGTLADSILHAHPACAAALRYITIERSAALRGEQAGRLLLANNETVLTNAPFANHSTANMVASMSEFPQGSFAGIVLANELLDNLPVDIYERRGRRWYECCVTLSKDGGFAETLVPFDENPGRASAEEELSHLVPDAHDGARVPLQHAAQEWLSSALELIDRGRIVCFDYARTTRWMSRHGWEDWLRTYRNHRPGSSPFDAPGTQDITCEVAIDQLAVIRKPDEDHTQSDFLEAHGLRELVAEAREAWHSNASIGDLGAARARGRVNEGRALTDGNGLGRYRVFEWEIADH